MDVYLHVETYMSSRHAAALRAGTTQPPRCAAGGDELALAVCSSAGAAAAVSAAGGTVGWAARTLLETLAVWAQATAMNSRRGLATLAVCTDLKALGAVPTARTILQKMTPDHLELRCNALPEQQMALITSGLCARGRSAAGPASASARRRCGGGRCARAGCNASSAPPSGRELPQTTIRGD